MNRQGLIEAPATVVSTAGELAEVETTRNTGCAGCSSARGCSVSVLGSLFGRRSCRLQVENPVNAQPGQRVVIGVPPEVLVKASLLLYLVPLVSLIAAAVAGDLAAGHLGWQSSEALSLLCAVSGLAGGLWWVSRLNRSIGADEYRGVILRVEWIDTATSNLTERTKPVH